MVFGDQDTCPKSSNGALLLHCAVQNLTASTDTAQIFKKPFDRRV